MVELHGERYRPHPAGDVLGRAALADADAAAGDAARLTIVFNLDHEPRPHTLARTLAASMASVMTIGA